VPTGRTLATSFLREKPITVEGSSQDLGKQTPKPNGSDLRGWAQPGQAGAAGYNTRHGATGRASRAGTQVHAPRVRAGHFSPAKQRRGPPVLRAGHGHIVECLDAWCCGSLHRQAISVQIKTNSISEVIKIIPPITDHILIYFS
jgi:hypothetical protein